MHADNLHRWQHDHRFGQDRRRPGEARTLIVIAITAAMMLVEIAAGIVDGSMALLADGLHMASHAVALGITAFAYRYARVNAASPQYSFGTGKVNALGGFTGALLLAMFALLMAVESVLRIVHPVDIVFNQAILVAVLGLLVNGVSALVLDVADPHHDESGQPHDRDHGHDHVHQHHDHNLKSAYLHVLADALTSILAIGALLVAKYLGQVWMDPAMGIVGALLVGRWSFGLLRTTSGILLDRQAPSRLLEQIRAPLEADGDTRVTDLHVWSIGPAIYSAQISVVAHERVPPEEYKARLPDSLGLVHVSVEVHPCEHTTDAGRHGVVRAMI
jgi:cation diffusion facilitator family transporter